MGDRELGWGGLAGGSETLDEPHFCAHVKGSERLVLATALSERRKPTSHHPTRLAIKPNRIVPILLGVPASTGPLGHDRVVRGESVYLVKSEESATDSTLSLNYRHVSRLLPRPLVVKTSKPKGTVYTLSRRAAPPHF